MRPSSRPSIPSVSPPSMAPPPVEYLDELGKLRRAEQLATRRNFQEAERIVDDLIARDPSNADYHAMRALLCFTSSSAASGRRAPLLDAIERALRLNEEQPRALYVKGMVFKRMGKRHEAMRYFQRALDADPAPHRRPARAAPGEDAAGSKRAGSGRRERRRCIVSRSRTGPRRPCRRRCTS